MCITRLLYRNLRHRTAKIIINGKKLNALVADTFSTRAVGLMFRDALASNECMLFIFNRLGRHGIWMRNMNFPIDIVWCDSMGRVVDVKENARPAKALEFTTYCPRSGASYVVELNAGFAKRNRIRKNSAIRILKGEENR